jgi:photosystem II stability/assembly factor-like uncharacterized protein
MARTYAKERRLMNPRLVAVFQITFLLTLTAAQGQWVQSTGPKGTSVRTLSSAGGTLFVGTWNRIFLSQDRGRTWSTDTGVSPMGDIVHLNGHYFSASPVGVRTREATGGTRPWTQAGLTGLWVSNFTSMGPYLFAGSTRALYRSEDGGVEWDSLPMSGLDDGVTELKAVDGVLYAGTSRHGVYYSLDSGETWAAGAGPIDSLYINMLAGSGPNLFALAPKALYRSDDRGVNWERVEVDTGNGRPISMAVEGTVLYLGTMSGWVLRSPDLGKSWTRAQASPSEWPIQDMTLIGSDIFASDESDVYRSSDEGATWTQVDLLDASISRFLSLDGDLFASSSGTGIHRSRDNGATWTTVNRGLRTDAAVYDLARLGEFVVAATSWHIFRTGDRGASWQQFRSGLPTYPYITSIIASQSGLLAGSDEGLFRSLDSGQTWKRTGDSVINRVWGGPMAEMGRHLLLGTYFLRPGTGGIYRSTDGGMTWTEPVSGLPPLKVRALLAKDGYFFAGVNPDTARGDQPVGMYRSADSGATWTRINNGLTDLNVRCLITANGVLLLGTRSGAFLSLDNGDTWTPVGGGSLPPILSLTVSGPYLVAGVENGSTWRLPLSQVTSIRGPHRSRADRALVTRDREGDGPYDIRGRDASGASQGTWKVWKRSPPME